VTLDLNIKKVTKNAYRITKVRNESALRIRVPGGHLDAKFLSIIQEIAGTVHLTTRQGFEVPGVSFDTIPEINKKLSPIIIGLEIDYGVRIDNPQQGYPSAGTRNISACIGNRVCPIANFDTTSLAYRIEKEIYPANLHFKIAITGCPNDCIKAHMQDFGVIAMAEPEYEYQSCVGCEACVKNCTKRVTGALTMRNGKVERDARKCIGCGECVGKCPTQAWTRNPEKFFRLIIMGRTGKKNPRIAMTFLEWASEDVVVEVIKNTYPYVEKYIDTTLPKEHIGYIVDRTGFQIYKEFVLKDVKLNPEIKVAKNIQWGGYKYVRDSDLGSGL